MLFLNGWFYVCLVLAAIVYRIVPKRVATPWLLAWTVAWLAWALPETLLVFSVVTVLTWAASYWITKRTENASRRAHVASALLVASVVGARLTVPVFGGLQVSTSGKTNEAFALIGIAYLALKVHHYFRSVVYDRKNMLSLVSLFLYFSYLPTITAGPIVRIPEWKILSESLVTEPVWFDFDVGTRRILWGLGKKILGVPLLGLVTSSSTVHGHRIGILVLVPVSLISIYLDFSGYSDIAIGSARFFGHRIRENFDEPFSATSLAHFWRRWHITMGDWLREHIFIPMGGMRSSRTRAAGISALVMLFCGLWHAFNLRFLLWGIYHAVLMFAEGFLGIKPLPPSAPKASIAIRRALVFLAMCGGTVFFIPEFWTR